VKHLTPFLRTEDSGEQSLEAYAWPGGYPIIYLDGYGCVLCPDCGNINLSAENENDRPVAGFIHYEGPPECCDCCSTIIESAYGDPDATAD
jgi:hypothetical protein